MHWYLVHTKPRQEKFALDNLQRQGYECYLPMLSAEKLRQRVLSVINEPLFPRYLFIRLDTGLSAKGWGPIRSTNGVSRLVSFGNEPAKIDDRLVHLLHSQENAHQTVPQRLFAKGERVMIVEGAFAGLEAMYQMADGEGRVMVLIELISKPVQLHVAPASLRKLA
ncbi:MAG: transcription/translation regulatory transformer protein RfaH [Rhodocyclaceae bacterium]|nr:transcription/translation regulatory transformer protein RfaH [Rhodocyclaceae bacterium]MDZ4215538.1 transcription/translation regulatory transformer protein RfaH [Rhodocyclaceae bacterium]